MNKLNLNWVTEHRVDFEYKKYILLAYLQHVEATFHENKIYPVLADLMQQHINLHKLKDEKLRVSREWPVALKQVDIKNLRLHYEKLFADDDTMQEIEHILDYALPLLDAHLEEGKELYDFAEQHMAIEPVGIVPIYKDEGYLLLRTALPAYVHVYSYALSVFDNSYEKLRALKVKYIRSYSYNLANTYNAIKYQLITGNKQLPNPATYIIESSIALPVRETYLPIAKRMLVREIVK